MSQHIVRSCFQGKPVSVMLGWDRPLGHYFLVIAEEDADDPIYSNLDQPNAYDMTVEDLQAVLVDHQIDVPAVMFEQIQLDRQNRVGNRCVSYLADGSLAA